MAIIETYDNEGNLISSEEVSDEPIRYLSPWDFRLLFTQTERFDIYGSNDGIVRDFLGALQTITTNVDLQDQQTIQGIGYLAMIGLIDQSRVSQILSGQPPV